MIVSPFIKCAVFPLFFQALLMTVWPTPPAKTSTGLGVAAIGSTAVEPATTDTAAPVNIRSYPIIIKTSALCKNL